jgi:hypothetical protein
VVHRAFAAFFSSSESKKDLVALLEYCSGYDYRDLLKQETHLNQSQLFMELGSLLKKANGGAQGVPSNNNTFFSDVTIVCNENTMSKSITFGLVHH